MLSKLRKERNISQRVLSEQLGLSHSAIGMYESGKREPDFETLQLIANYFGVDMNYLLNGDTEDYSNKSFQNSKRSIISDIDRIYITLNELGIKNINKKDIEGMAPRELMQCYSDIIRCIRNFVEIIDFSKVIK